MFNFFTPAGYRLVALVATKHRSALLASRSLPSIASQSHRCDALILVDDSPDPASLEHSRQLAHDLGLPVQALRNRRTAGAAGAWNTGLDHLARHTADPRCTFVAFLDDDDLWLPDHLAACHTAIAAGATFMASGFTRVENDAPDQDIEPPASLDTHGFYVGNPGIQPSSMVIRLDRLLAAGLFDEALLSCTDRDLLIRLIRISRSDYLTTGSTTVRHFACSDRERLSTPSSPQKTAGLDAFFAKHGHHMTTDQLHAAQARASLLFGWQTGASIAAPPVQPVEPRQPQQDPIEEVHLVVGLITDPQRRPGAVDGLLQDLLALRDEPGLVNLDVLILENGNGNGNAPDVSALEAAAHGWRAQGLCVHVITPDARRLAMDAGDLEPFDGGQLPIGPARTALQTYLYHFIKARPGAVAWILDDDMRLDPLVDIGGTRRRQRMPLIPYLARLRRDGVDIAIGNYTGAAPLPALSTLRVQMVDLLANLRWLAGLSPDAPLPDMSGANAAMRSGRRDFYYDLSHRETDRLETPFWLEPAHSGESVGTAAERLCAGLGRMLDGEQLTRPLVEDAAAMAAFSLTEHLHRGGNTFVFNVEALGDVPNAVPDIGGRITRRSDMIWSLAQRTWCRRRVVSVPLSVYHAREAQHGTATEHERCLTDDICGYALFSALQDHARDGSVDVGERAEKFRDERLAAFRLSLHRTRGLAAELARLANCPGQLAPHAAALTAFAHVVLERVDGALLMRVTDAVGKLAASEAHGFLAQMPDLMAQQRRRVDSTALIPDQLRSQRTANAIATVTRLVPHASEQRALRWLGSGAEGVVLTDETSVFKVLDYWKPTAAHRARQRLHALVGRWPTSAGLYGIERFLTEGLDSLLVYPFDASLPYTGGHGPALVDLMVDCFANGLICRNIHPKNLRLAGNRVRLIDYGSDLLLSDEIADFGSEFTLMCRRAFLSWRFWDRADLQHLLRASLTDASLPELTGFADFMVAVRQSTGQTAVQDPIVDMVRAMPACRVLDFGCGKGEVSRQLAAAGHDVVAYDPDPALRERLGRLGSDRLATVFRFDQALALGPYDVVICRRVLCLLDHAALTGVVDELRRSVAPNGRVLLAVCHPGYSPRIATSEARPHAASTADPDSSFTWIKHHRKSGRPLIEFHRPERVLRKVVQRAGFQIRRRLERETIDQFRFEPACDLLVYDLQPTDPPDCTLLIKACAMEAATLATSVRQLVRQLHRPRPFHRVVLTLDTRIDGFLRQYTAGNLAALRESATTLLAQGWVDQVVEAPSDAQSCSRLNLRWLGRDEPDSHAANGAPLSTIFTGFDACRTPYVLQADLDVLVGHGDPDHDYLRDMVQALVEDEHAVTVAFNIAQAQDRPYTAEGPGGPWRVESRLCLLHMARLAAVLPLSAPLSPSPASTPPEPMPAWHRALDVAVKRGHGHSLRGGDRRTFYIHPTNDRKGNPLALSRIAARVVAGDLAPGQTGAVDLLGTTEQWLTPTRCEPFVFVISGRNVEPGRFRRCLDSVVRQRRQDWGAIVFDDASHPAWSAMQQALCEAHAARITFVSNPERRGLLANTVEAIRQHCARPDTVIITLDADDCLIGDDVLDRLAAQYAGGADMTVGSMCRTDKSASYPARLDDARATRGGNVWQHLRSFRKFLFDAVPDDYLRLDGEYVELASDWALMLPMTDLALAPRWISQTLYLHEPGGARDPETIRRREAVIATLIARTALIRQPRSIDGVAT
jgi:SAM-dependent methyltransferase/GT2 family glycosyltransferase